MYNELEGPMTWLYPTSLYLSGWCRRGWANVLASEPHLAPFADRDGYAIYEKDYPASTKCLTPDGKIYLEIGYIRSQSKELFKKRFLTNWKTNLDKIEW